MGKTTKIKNRWSQQVNKKSNALTLETGIFTWNNPKKIAVSLRRSALISKRRKASAYQSAMSMLNFYINRAGKKLSAKRKNILQKAKDELRSAFGKAKLNE